MILENDVLKIALSSKGAELQSLYHKTDKREYLWQADANYWGKHAPILFPVIGKLKDGRYTHKGQDYSLPTSHGFARDNEFQLIKSTPTEAVYQFESNESTKASYPFAFVLKLSYTLVANTLKVGYVVENPDKEHDLPFSIGAHPAFNCPLEDGLAFSDYYLELEKAETLASMSISPQGLFIAGKTVPVPTEGKRIPLNYQLFDDDALVFDNLQSNKVTLASDKSKHSVAMDFTGFPYMAFWSMPHKDAPFLCLEPWFGRADNADVNPDFSLREGTQILAPESVWTSSYTLTIV